MSTTSIEFLQTLEDFIRERSVAATSQSYTARLLESGTKRIAQKVGEEGVELALAAVGGNREEAISEAADLFYHVLVLLTAEDIRLAEVVAALEKRHSG